MQCSRKSLSQRAKLQARAVVPTLIRTSERHFCCSAKMNCASSNGTAVRPLFGGALAAVIPHSAGDVSELREVPDNQEVFAHEHTDQSFIVEMLEYQAQVQDAEAARYHFDDLAGSNEASGVGSSEVIRVEALDKSELSLQDCSCAFLLSGIQRVSKFNEEAKNTVNVHLGLFRLPQYSTDILVTFNDPTSISPLSSSAAHDGAVIAAPWTAQDFLTLLQSLRLLDPGVFG
ncbi:hypothetical protein GJAV_G00125760 [Gymnothorax javanicus]|nr:hypothetical protein GJAV_G00125760 [Gymnothorax javanicus]